MEFTICPGCGLRLLKSDSLPEKKFNSSKECWELFCQLSALTPNYDEEFIHQMAIDTYEAQHGGGDTKNIAVVFGLVGLYLSLEKNYSGRQVQKAHMILGEKNKEWPKLEPPTFNWEYTVKDVLDSSLEKGLKEEIRKWAEVTWRGWGEQQKTIEDICNFYLG